MNNELNTKPLVRLMLIRNFNELLGLINFYI